MMTVFPYNVDQLALDTYNLIGSPSGRVSSPRHLLCLILAISTASCDTAKAVLPIARLLSSKGELNFREFIFVCDLIGQITDVVDSECDERNSCSASNSIFEPDQGELGFDP